MEARMPRTLTKAEQLAYLDAMGVEVWRLRDTAVVASGDPVCPPQLKLAPGSGGVLLICAEDTHSASRLANDINRTLGSVPVWAWPHADGDGVELADAVEDNLFTTVAIFGQELAVQLFGADLPVNLNSAKVVLLPEMQDILGQASARQSLWNIFRRSGMVGVPENNA